MQNSLNHVAVIMDGNSRWAKKNGKKKFFGYHRGAFVAQNLIEYANFIDIKYLTLYAFASENEQRPKNEVEIVMKLLEYCLK